MKGDNAKTDGTGRGNGFRRSVWWKTVKIQQWLDIGCDEDEGIEGQSKFVFGFLNLLNGMAIN